MRKLISLLAALFVAFQVYAKEPEYTSVGKQFNTVVVNVPASFTIIKGEEHSVKIVNMSNEFFVYKIVNDTLIIKSKYMMDVNTMKARHLKVTLTHPNPVRLYHNIKPQGRGLSKTKSGDQN